MKNKMIKFGLLAGVILWVLGFSYGNTVKRNQVTGNSIETEFVNEDVFVDDDFYIDENEFVDDDYYVNGQSNIDPSKAMDINKAKKIALNKVPGANDSHIGSFHLDYEHGRLVYEGEIYYNGWEHEFDIDAVTGKIVKWNRDRD